MKTVISAQTPSITAPMDPRFGRAAYFCIYDNESGKSLFLDNPHIDAQGGAGVKTSEMIVEAGASKVISGHFGPKAKEILDKFNIQLIEIEEGKTIQEIIEMLNNNK
jgi:predicted Fe-Mo cluster-binding NifX family protein